MDSKTDTVEGNATKTWDELVTEGRALAADIASHQFRLGDLALDAAPLGSHGGAATGALGVVNRFACAIGVDFKSLQEYRWVASRWPTESRRLDTASFSVHHVLATLDDRFEVIASQPRWTVREAREFRSLARPAKATEVGDDSFEDVAEEELLPKSGCCTMCGTPPDMWPPLSRSRRA